MDTKPVVVLASASPRRQELLYNAGIQFTVEPADIDETSLPRESAKACAERLARQKALKIADKRPETYVLGADTVVAVDGAILGKPLDDNDAARMLTLLSGRTHEVVTGVSLARPHQDKATPEINTASETTRVTMCKLTDEEIRDYVATGEPMDKAGAYAIQGRASRWIPKIEGDYSNVVGLPVALVYRMLRDAKAI